MFELLHCPSTICFHFNYMVLVHDIPILPFNLFGIQWKHTKSKETSKVRYVRRKRKPRIMYWIARIKASYPNQLGQNSTQSQKLMHTSMPKVNNTSLGKTASHLHHTCSKLDSESYTIAIDNCCSYSMSNSKSNLGGKLTPWNVNIKGTGGTNQITKCRTVCWVIKDNEVKPHKMVIPRHTTTQSHPIACCHHYTGCKHQETKWAPHT